MTADLSKEALDALVAAHFGRARCTGADVCKDMGPSSDCRCMVADTITALRTENEVLRTTERGLEAQRRRWREHPPLKHSALLRARIAGRDPLSAEVLADLESYAVQMEAERDAAEAALAAIQQDRPYVMGRNAGYEHAAQEAEAALAAAMEGAVDRDRVAEAMEGGGFWRSCSGCHESNEGVPTGPYSAAMECFLGVGCYECGGIGAVWDNTDYSRLYDEVEANPAAQDQDMPTAPSWPAAEAENTTLPAIDETTGALIRREGEA